MSNETPKSVLGEDGGYYWPMIGTPVAREEAWSRFWAVMRDGLAELAMEGRLPEWIVDPDCADAMKSASTPGEGRRAAMELWITKLIRGDVVEMQVFPNLEQMVFDGTDDLRHARRRARREGMTDVVVSLADRYQLRIDIARRSRCSGRGGNSR
ncbi:hypothetical protein [Angustibacter luteus]|uniref:Uncharacterized protein n=1 Tax=Angustibacter luteus TaxID=658456 RepID=A0ABW1JHA8_9ACTN